MSNYRVTRGFIDYDGVNVRNGTAIEEVVRRGYSNSMKKYFWNCLANGAVVAVTLGYPSHVAKPLDPA